MRERERERERERVRVRERESLDVITFGKSKSSEALNTFNEQLYLELIGSGLTSSRFFSFPFSYEGRQGSWFISPSSGPS